MMEGTTGLPLFAVLSVQVESYPSKIVCMVTILRSVDIYVSVSSIAPLVYLVSWYFVGKSVCSLPVIKI